MTGNTIVLDGHGLAPGQAVTYHAPNTASKFSSGGVDVKLGSNGQLVPGPNVLVFQVDFKHNASGGDTITRQDGDWADDEFLAGQVITVSGSGINDGVYTIHSVFR